MKPLIVVVIRLTSVASAMLLLLSAPAYAKGLPILRVRTSGPNAHRLIEDSSGRPFFMAGICPQNLIYRVPRSKFDDYFKVRHDQGYNMAWVLVGGIACVGDYNDFTCPHYQPTDNAGHHLRLNTNTLNMAAENINPAYAETVDAMVASASRNGIYLFLDLMDAPGSDRLWPKKDESECRSWGEFWANRYANDANVNFMLGNDEVPEPQGNWIVDGVRKYMPDRLFTIDEGMFNHCDGSGNRNMPNPIWHAVAKNASWINLHGWYAYESPGQIGDTMTYQYASWMMYTQNAVWGVEPAPVFLVESQYSVVYPGKPMREGNGLSRMNEFVTSDCHLMRRQMWSVVLGGGSGWGIIGDYNDAVNNPLPINDPVNGMAAICKDFFVKQRWDLLIPDYAHNFLVSQSTDPSRFDPAYVSAAVASDGSFGAVYFPGVPNQSNVLTIDMSRLGRGVGKSVARWFDPVDGKYLQEPGSPFVNSGLRNFTVSEKNSAGNTDWVLLLESVKPSSGNGHNE